MSSSCRHQVCVEKAPSKGKGATAATAVRDNSHTPWINQDRARADLFCRFVSAGRRKQYMLVFNDGAGRRGQATEGRSVGRKSILSLIVGNRPVGSNPRRRKGRQGFAKLARPVGDDRKTVRPPAASLHYQRRSSGLVCRARTQGNCHYRTHLSIGGHVERW
jgi:hypothetical protein